LQESHPPECDAANFHANNWVGLNNFETSWDTSTTIASSAEACCAMCYDGKNCAGWLATLDGDTIWCTFVDKDYKADGADKACSLGYPMVTFSGKAAGASFAGYGPCSKQNRP
jgi:hypothetical protein